MNIAQRKCFLKTKHHLQTLIPLSHQNNCWRRWANRRCKMAGRVWLRLRPRLFIWPSVDHWRLWKEIY